MDSQTQVANCEGPKSPKRLLRPAKRSRHLKARDKVKPSRHEPQPIHSILALPPLLKKGDGGEYDCTCLSKIEKRLALQKLKSRVEVIEDTITSVHQAVGHLMQIICQK